MNMERKYRFLQENCIIVGVIPGPHEPELSLNSFLEPLVEELLDLWKGVVMHTADEQQIVARAALLCVGFHR